MNCGTCLNFDTHTRLARLRKAVSTMKGFGLTLTIDGSRTAAAIAIALACFAGLTQKPLYAQAEPTAIRSGDLQVGGMFNLGDSDYSVNRFRGYGFYSTFDFRYHFGLAAEFHRAERSGQH